MKIIYHPKIDITFTDYGILIPIAGSRSKKVFDQLVDDKICNDYYDINNLPHISKEDLLLAHQEDFINRLFRDKKSLEREILNTYELVDEDGNYHRYDPKIATKDITEAFEVVLKQVGATYKSMEIALTEKFCFFLGGGMHHSMSFGGRGFCLVNDIVIGIRKLQAEGRIKNAWVIDVDAHKGDGTAEITAKDASIQTFSIHMKEGWPLNSGSVRDPWFIPSNVEVGVDVGEENLYLTKLEQGLNELKERMPNPDLCVVVQGADPFEFDELESANLIKLSKEQMLERDKFVYDFLLKNNIPQSYVMAGGYGQRSWEIYYQFLKFVGQRSS